jgi:hypothetical protein
MSVLELFESDRPPASRAALRSDAWLRAAQARTSRSRRVSTRVQPEENAVPIADIAMGNAW